MQVLSMLNDYILIAPDERPKVTARGIIIPDANTEKATTGVVMSVTRGWRNRKGELIPSNFKVGERVGILKNPPTRLIINYQGKQCNVLSERDIAYKIEDENNEN